MPLRRQAGIRSYDIAVSSIDRCRYLDSTASGHFASNLKYWDIPPLEGVRGRTLWKVERMT